MRSRTLRRPPRVADRLWSARRPRRTSGSSRISRGSWSVEEFRARERQTARHFLRVRGSVRRILFEVFALDERVESGLDVRRKLSGMLGDGSKDGIKHRGVHAPLLVEGPIAQLRDNPGAGPAESLLQGRTLLCRQVPFLSHRRGKKILHWLLV